MTFLCEAISCVATCTGLRGPAAAPGRGRPNGGRPPRLPICRPAGPNVVPGRAAWALGSRGSNVVRRGCGEPVRAAGMVTPGRPPQTSMPVLGGDEGRRGDVPEPSSPRGAEGGTGVGRVGACAAAAAAGGGVG